MKQLVYVLIRVRAITIYGHGDKGSEEIEESTHSNCKHIMLLYDFVPTRFLEYYAAVI